MIPDLRRSTDGGSESLGTVTVLSESVAFQLEELVSTITRLSEQEYTRRSSERFFRASIGGHVRHILDHVTAFVKGVHSEIKYDARERGTAIEHDPNAAVMATQLLCCQLRLLVSNLSDTGVSVEVVPCSTLPPVMVQSTVARELVFLVSHTVHHKATISMLMYDLGVVTPSQFGVAPATLQHLAHVHTQCHTS